MNNLRKVCMKKLVDKTKDGELIFDIIRINRRKAEKLLNEGWKYTTKSVWRRA